VNAADMKTIQAGVLAILAEASLAEAAARLSVSADVLLAAARVYRAAGHAALEDWASQSGWHQVRLRRLAHRRKGRSHPARSGAHSGGSRRSPRAMVLHPQGRQLAPSLPGHDRGRR
jgi:hypothetical protein